MTGARLARSCSFAGLFSAVSGYRNLCGSPVNPEKEAMTDEAKATCKATTNLGRPCKKQAVDGDRGVTPRLRVRDCKRPSGEAGFLRPGPRLSAPPAWAR